MTIQRLKFLLDNFEKKKLNPAEQAELTAWYDSRNSWKGLIDSLDSAEQDTVRELLWSNILGRLPLQEQSQQLRRHPPLRSVGLTEQTTQQQAGQQGLTKQPNRRLRPYTRLIAAASIIGLLVGGAILYSRLIRPGHAGLNPGLSASRQHLTNPSILPGGNKAILTLSNGKTITLDNASNGILDKEEGTAIDKKADGQLVYEKLDATAPTISEVTREPIFNVLSTPQGGQYKIILPDGTKVWLNAASTLRYPTTFTGSERDVTLNGEAYFEVAANKTMPFRITTADSTRIRVLGTSFNIMAYSDEEFTKTTLLDGAVQMSSGKTSTTLRPGEQGSLKLHTSQLSTSKVDVEEAIAWKNGLFQFKSADIRTVMRQIARWYNVEVNYEGEIPEHFTGQAYRKEDISVILEILELTGNVRFNINGKKVTVLRK